MDFSGCQRRPPNRPEAGHPLPQAPPPSQQHSPPKKSLSPNPPTHTPPPPPHLRPHPPLALQAVSPFSDTGAAPHMEKVTSHTAQPRGLGRGAQGLLGSPAGLQGAEGMKGGMRRRRPRLSLSAVSHAPVVRGGPVHSPHPEDLRSSGDGNHGHPTPPRVKHQSPYLSLMSVFLRWDPGNKTTPTWEGISHVGQKDEHARSQDTTCRIGKVAFIYTHILIPPHVK